MYNTEASRRHRLLGRPSSTRRRVHGKVTAYDSPIYIADAAVYLMTHQPDLGIENPYALDETQFAAAVDLLKEQRANIGEYWSDYLKEIQRVRDRRPRGRHDLAGHQELGRREGQEVVLPDEGTTGWSDTWMIASKAKSPNCAYPWLNYIARPEANAAAPSTSVRHRQSGGVRIPERGLLRDVPRRRRGVRVPDLVLATPIAQCLDGRTDVECIDYSEWTKAWTEIKG